MIYFWMWLVQLCFPAQSIFKASQISYKETVFPVLSEVPQFQTCTRISQLHQSNSTLSLSVNTVNSSAVDRSREVLHSQLQRHRQDAERGKRDFRHGKSRSRTKIRKGL